MTYIDDVELRQRIEKQLNRAELSNKFSKAVLFANNQELQVATREEQEITTSCQVLIQNSIVLWNYLYLSQLLASTDDAYKKSTLLNIIKSGSIMSWQHINMQGEYDFTKPINDLPTFDMDKILSLKLDAV